MDAVLMITKSGFKVCKENSATYANNLVNSATPGFIPDYNLLVEAQRANNKENSGNGVKNNGSRKIFMQGALDNTKQPLDLAISGSGFFKVSRPDGTEAYTRDGRLSVKDGQLVLKATEDVIEPPIFIREEDLNHVVIKENQALNTSTGESLGTISLYDFERPEQLQPLDNNLFRESGENNYPREKSVHESKIEQGYVEKPSESLTASLMGIFQTKIIYSGIAKFTNLFKEMMENFNQTL